MARCEITFYQIRILDKSEIIFKTLIFQGK